MKILVLGASGMAGHTVVLRLKEKGHSVTGLARKALPFCDTVVADLFDKAALDTVTQYDAIINCAGALVKAVEDNPYEGIWLDACLPRLLAKLTENTHTKIIHLSTDCVFSGQDGGRYTESSFPSNNTLYGRSKYLGELNDSKNLTFRMSIIGPEIKENGIGLFHWFMKQESVVNGYSKAIWSGVTTITLADAIEAALAQGLTNLYHLVNNEAISKYDLLKLFNTLRKEPAKIVPSEAVSEDKSLVNTRKDFNFFVPSYADMVFEMGKWIQKYKELYKYTIDEEVGNG